MENRTNFHVLLKERRELLNYSMAQMAKFVDVKFTTYCNYERGIREPKLTEFSRIMKKLRLDLGDLDG